MNNLNGIIDIFIIVNAILFLYVYEQNGEYETPYITN